MNGAEQSDPILSTVPDNQRVPLGRLAGRDSNADGTRAKRSEGEFNSSI